MKNKAVLFAFCIWIVAVLLLWGLAFFPQSAFDAQWLDQARTACFGIIDNGLPDTAGFLLLTLAPLMMLSAILITWPGELMGQLRSFHKFKVGKLISSIVVILIAIEAVWAYDGISSGLKISRFDFQNPSKESLPSTYPKTDIKAAEFNLVNQYGEKVSIASSQGQTVVLTFAFAHCQTICPTIVKQAIEGIKGLEMGSIKLLVITLDPWRDTPKSLPGLAKKWELPENAYVLSGSIEDVTATIEAYNMPITRNEQNGDILHPAITYIIDERGHIRYTFNNAPFSWITQGVKNLRSLAKN